MSRHRPTRTASRHRLRRHLGPWCLAAAVFTASGVLASAAPAQSASIASSRPSRIISLSPTATEMLFAIGAGPQVVAVDEDSDYPKSAPRTSLSGLEPNVEAVAKYRPNLVVISYDPNGFAHSLEALGITVLVQSAPPSLSGAYAQIEQLGRATGHEHKAAVLVGHMRRKIAAAVAGAPKLAHPTYYYELEQDYYSVTSSTFVGRLFSKFGLRNIADAAKGVASSGGYPQLSSEYVVHADPDLIFLADTICCHQSPTTVAHRPGWGAIRAVRDGDVVGLNDDIASRWGPRVVQLADDIERALWRYERRQAA